MIPYVKDCCEFPYPAVWEQSSQQDSAAWSSLASSDALPRHFSRSPSRFLILSFTPFTHLPAFSGIFPAGTSRCSHIWFYHRHFCCRHNHYYMFYLVTMLTCMGFCMTLFAFCKLLSFHCHVIGFHIRCFLYLFCSVSYVLSWLSNSCLCLFPAILLCAPVFNLWISPCLFRPELFL